MWVIQVNNAPKKIITAAQPNKNAALLIKFAIKNLCWHYIFCLKQEMGSCCQGHNINVALSSMCGKGGQLPCFNSLADI